MKPFCKNQIIDSSHVYCTAHIHEGRVLYCIYKNKYERARSKYLCLDFMPIKEKGRKNEKITRSM